MLRLAKEDPFPSIMGTFMGRDALLLAVSSLDLSPNDKVLLPAYLCREVLKPFLGKTRIEFYDIQTDLAVEPEVIRSKLAEGRIKAMLIINYFGFMQPYRKQIKEICEDQGTILIEDCAHSLLTEGSGETGHLLVYSFRKILPVADGGGLKTNMRDRIIAPNYYPKICSNALSVFSIAKSLLNIRSEVLSRAGLSSRTRYLPGATLNSKSNRTLPLSSFAYNGIGNISFPEIVKKRRSNFERWWKLAERTDLFVPVFRNLPFGVCPSGFPVKVKERDLAKSRLLKEGIYLETHWHLPASIGREFVNSHRLSAQLLTLPVYPELALREREGIENFFVPKLALRY